MKTKKTSYIGIFYFIFGILLILLITSVIFGIRQQKIKAVKETYEQKLSEARHKREIAQYSITKQTTKNIAEKIKVDAFSFVNKVQEVLEI